jgi:hypothetical protein
MSKRLISAAVLLPLSACGDDRQGSPQDVQSTQATLEIPAPGKLRRDLATVETWSEQAANDLLDFSDKLRRRDFAAAGRWIAADFQGHGWAIPGPAAERSLPLGATRLEHDVSGAPLVDGTGFLAGLRAHLSPWQRVENVLFKVKGAEFAQGRERWGKLRLKVTLQGSGAEGDPRSVIAWLDARADWDGEAWRLSRARLESLTELRRPAPLFADVSTSSGVAHSGERFGTGHNKSYAWNGAAAGDIDGDGLFDIYLPSRPRGMFYRALPEGGFVEAAVEHGLDTASGGTGAVFFDFDNDGDQDLAVADVGWVEPDGRPGGQPLRLLVNEGGRFRQSGGALGFDRRCHGYSVSVCDFDGDGWLDVYVCSYGRVDSQPNDSWTDARNGSPDLLLRNVQGTRFEDVTAAAGLNDTRWSYASAWADYDEDGDPDLYVANDYGPNSLWRNRGDGTFEDVAEATGTLDVGNGMGCAWGDLDGDGALDLYVANMSSTAGSRILSRLAADDGAVALLSKLAAGNSIFLRRGSGFERLPSKAGGVDAMWAWSVALVDLDLDARLDVFCTNGFITGDTPADT